MIPCRWRVSNTIENPQAARQVPATAYRVSTNVDAETAARIRAAAAPLRHCRWRGGARSDSERTYRRAGNGCAPKPSAKPPVIVRPVRAALATARVPHLRRRARHELRPRRLRAAPGPPCRVPDDAPVVARVVSLTPTPDPGETRLLDGRPAVVLYLLPKLPGRRPAVRAAFDLPCGACEAPLHYDAPWRRWWCPSCRMVYTTSRRWPTWPVSTFGTARRAAIAARGNGRLPAAPLVPPSC